MVKRAQCIKYLIPLMLLASCGKRSYLSLMQDRIDARYLASTHVGTPDPRQACPPYGQRIIIDWFLPEEISYQNPHIDLHLLFWNNTTEVVTYPIKGRMGNKVYYLLGKEFDEKKGVLTYKAEIVTEDGVVFTEWKHQLWVNFINVEQEIPEPIPDYPNAHMDPIEEIYEEEEMSDEFFYPPADRMLREELPPVEPGEISPQQHEMDEQS
jgi:hypothetical protein